MPGEGCGCARGSNCSGDSVSDLKGRDFKNRLWLFRGGVVGARRGAVRLVALVKLVALVAPAVRAR